MCRIRARPLGLRYLLWVNAFACVMRWFGSIVVSAVRNGGPLINLVGQLISGLNSQNHGYLRMIQSHPRSTIRNFSILALPPWNMAMGSQYFIHPPRLSVPSTFRSPIGSGSSLGLIPNFSAVLMLMQFLLAPLSIRAFSSTIPRCVTKLKGSQISLATKLIMMNFVSCAAVVGF